MQVYIALSNSHEPSILYCHIGKAHNFYQFFKQELNLPGFNCVISRYIKKLSPYNLLHRSGIMVKTRCTKYCDQQTGSLSSGSDARFVFSFNLACCNPVNECEVQIRI